MNIAQITSIYLPVPPKTYGGTERIVYHLCQELSRRGHQVDLFASGDSRVDCNLHSVIDVASQDDPDSTFYLEKEYEARNTYNLYCQAARFDIVHEFEDGERAGIVYEARTSTGERFRNSELYTVRGGRLVATEVYFGWSLPHQAALGTHLEK